MKITKRIILIILSALLVLSAAACGKAEDDPKGEENTPPVEQDPPAQEEPPSEIEKYTLPEDLRAEIDAAYHAKYNDYPNWDFDDVAGAKYYGTYNGYAIMFSGSQAFELDVETIGKEEFIYGTGFTIYAYKDGVLNLLSDVYYDKKDLSDEDIAKIAEYHRALNPLYYDDFPTQPAAELTMSAEEVNTIKQAYLNKDNPSEPATVENVHIRLYGKTDKAFVMIIEADWLIPATVECRLTIGELIFIFGNNNLPVVYSNGELYGLKEAFDGGVLTYENLRTLYGNFDQKVFVHY